MADLLLTMTLLVVGFLGAVFVGVVVGVVVVAAGFVGLSAFSTLVPLSFSNTRASESSEGSNACNSAWS